MGEVTLPHIWPDAIKVGIASMARRHANRHRHRYKDRDRHRHKDMQIDTDTDTQITMDTNIDL